MFKKKHSDKFQCELCEREFEMETKFNPIEMKLIDQNIVIKFGTKDA